MKLYNYMDDILKLLYDNRNLNALFKNEIDIINDLGWRDEADKFLVKGLLKEMEK